MLNKNKTYAVIGATDNQEKYGYKVLKQLKDSGYQAVPVNPKGRDVLGLKVYKDISDIEEKIDVAVFVVPPEVTESLLPSVKKSGIGCVWLQPGSESDAAITYCRDNGIECIHDACLIQEFNK